MLRPRVSTAIPTDHYLEIWNGPAGMEIKDKIASEANKVLAQIKELGMEVIEIDQTPFRAKAKDVVAQFRHLKPWFDKMTAQ